MARSRSWSPLRMGIVALIVAAVVAGFAARILAGGDGDDGAQDGETSPQAEARAWQAKAETAVEPLVDALPPYVAAASSWTKVDRPPGNAPFASAVDTFVAKATSADRRVDELAAGPGAAHDLLHVAAGLYLAAGRVHTAAVDTAPSALRDEADRLAVRLRTLGDRVYDRSVNAARAAAGEPLLFEDVGPDVRLKVPPAVPDWDELGLAPGSTLSTGPSNGGRPTPTDQVERAVATGDTETLGQLAARLVADAARVSPDAVPDEATARRGLGLLVLADACRAAQLGALLADPGPSQAEIVDEVATDLAELGADPALTNGE